MNYTITITPTVNGWLTEKRAHYTGQNHQFVYATVESMAADLLNVINYEPAAQAGATSGYIAPVAGMALGAMTPPLGTSFCGSEKAQIIRTGLRDAQP